jgi:hypothetical protein
LRGIEGAANRIIANISVTCADILDSPGKVWDLDNVVNRTFGVLGLEEGSAAYRLIKTELKSRAFGKMLRDVFLALVNIGLGILAVSRLGTPIAILAGLGAAAVSTTTYMIHREEYNFEKAASGTGTSSQNSLLSIEPNALWLYLDLVGIGIDAFVALKILGKVAKTAISFKLAKASEEVAAKTRLLVEFESAAKAMLPADDASKAIAGIAKNLDDAEHVKLIRSGENTEVLVKNEGKVVEGATVAGKVANWGPLQNVLREETIRWLRRYGGDAWAKVLKDNADRLLKELTPDQINHLAHMGPLNAETLPMLMKNPQLIDSLIANREAMRLLRKCASPCFPPEMTLGDISRVQKYIDDMGYAGQKIDENLLNDYLYQNRSNLEKATKRFVNNDIPLSNKIPGSFKKSTMEEIWTAHPEMKSNPAWMAFMEKLVSEGMPPVQISDMISMAKAQGTPVNEVMALLDKIPNSQIQNVLGMMTHSPTSFEQIFGMLRKIDQEGSWGSFLTKMASQTDNTQRWVHTANGQVITVDAALVPPGTQPGSIISLNGQELMYLGNEADIAFHSTAASELHGILNPRGTVPIHQRVQAENLVDAPSYRGGEEGHAKALHGVDLPKCEPVLNHPDRVFTGLYEKSGRPVDVYWKTATSDPTQGNVVITVHGDKNSIITAYGEAGFATKGKIAPVNPARWENSASYVEVH